MTVWQTIRLMTATGMLSVVAAAAAQAQAQQSPTAPAAPAAQRPAVQVDANSIVGSTVRSSDGRDIGKVSRLMVDPSDGRVTTVIMTIGGTLGVGGETVSIPWGSVRVGQDGRNLVLTVDQQIIEQAPSASPRSGAQPKQ